MLLNDDCLVAMQKLIDDGVQVDSIVTDPPYHLQSIVDRFGKEGSAPAKHGTDGAFARASKGFMGQEWDGGDIAFRKETWELALKLLKPGGHLLAFSASRNYHRMAVAIEDAGFEIRDQLMWLYGSGFPKSHNLGDGWGTALKPAHEPIVMARKFIEGTNKNNREKYGTGGINIDGCRVEVDDNDPQLRTINRNQRLDDTSGQSWGLTKDKDNTNVQVVKSEGRFPANIMHDGIEEDWARFFYCPKVSKSERGEDNTHPTVKPQELMKYLCRLVTPKGGIVLDPFMGSGSAGMAAKDEGFEFIGIEREKEYFEIAEKRINSASPLMEFM
jgi:site-specific DNA-methyltransferase (adenine-specific)